MRILIFTALTALFAGSAHAQGGLCPLAYSGGNDDRLDPGCWVEKAEYKDDPLEETVSVSTNNHINIQRNGDKAVDVGIAYIRNRSTGAWVVSAMFYIAANERIDPVQVNFGSPLRTVDSAGRIDTVNCRPTPCRYTEFSRAALSEADLRSLIAGPEEIPFRLIGRYGERFDGIFHHAEIEAVLRVAGLAEHFGLKDMREPVAENLTAADRRKMAASKAQ